MSQPVSAAVDELNRTYERLHVAKEDAFWTAYMGLSDDAAAARAELDRREIELKRYVQDPAQLSRVREALARARAGEGSDEDRLSLEGWERTFAANAIESPRARALAEEIVEREGALAQARGRMELGYRHPETGFTRASSVELAVMQTTATEEPLRRAAWDGLRSIEPCVLASGFVDVVAKRNELGRALGGEDYYDAKVRRVEGMSKAEIFALLDELEERTREPARASLDLLRQRSGTGAATPWNVRYFTAGDVTRDQDPYFPFDRAVERWGRSFAALGVSYRGARLVLDLVDRPGKHENGFMHGPETAWVDRGRWRPARIQFTANAIPGMVGSGQRAAKTLFHEGGHAAHFANIEMPSPCFAQEFAPTSVSFAETQSMFLDSLLEDADWMTRYAADGEGRALPLELIEDGLSKKQPFAAWALRAMIVVCYAERAIYEIPEGELSAESILAAVRREEQRLTFLEDGAPRPTLSVPHLLDGEASAYYHGYVLALMAVHQTRNFFLGRDGHLVDNARIGPDLREHYWKPGNSRDFRSYVRELTGEELGPRALAEHVNRPVPEAVAAARAAVRRLEDVPVFEGSVELEAEIRLAHGNETVAELEGDFDAMSRTYGEWIRAQAAARA